MIVRDINDIDPVQGETWQSTRIILKKDGMGFSFHETIIHAGTTTTMEYKNHYESVYCVEGEGLLEDLTNNKTYEIKPGILYALNGHERHNLIAKTELRLLCVFNPPCTGQEKHNPDGAYEIVE